MSRVKYLAGIMSLRQKEIYNLIVAKKKYVARGPVIATCRVLQQLGLIMPDPEANGPNEYILNGKPLVLPFAKKLPLPKDVIKEISEAPVTPALQSIPDTSKHNPVLWAQPLTPPTIYSNITREQHVERWLSEPVKVKAKVFAPVKCLTHEQMEYIMANHERQTAGEMAAYLGKENMDVILFCQKNAIEPLRKGKRIGYNLKKTA